MEQVAAMGECKMWLSGDAKPPTYMDRDLTLGPMPRPIVYCDGATPQPTMAPTPLSEAVANGEITVGFATPPGHLRNPYDMMVLPDLEESDDLEEFTNMFELLDGAERDMMLKDWLERHQAGDIPDQNEGDMPVDHEVDAAVGGLDTNSLDGSDADMSDQGMLGAFPFGDAVNEVDTHARDEAGGGGGVRSEPFPSDKGADKGKGRGKGRGGKSKGKAAAVELIPTPYRFFS